MDEKELAEILVLVKQHEEKIEILQNKTFESEMKHLSNTMKIKAMGVILALLLSSIGAAVAKVVK